MNESQGKQWRAPWDSEPGEPENHYGLEPAPMPREWILEGSPITRCRRLWGSTDDLAFTVMWDCTASRFNWFYDVDETICLLEGSVIITDPQGRRHILRPMDTFHFPSGSRYHWNVPQYVRKLAFVHVPLSVKLRFAKGLYQRIKSILRISRGDRRKAAGPGASLGGA